MFVFCENVEFCLKNEQNDVGEFCEGNLVCNFSLVCLLLRCTKFVNLYISCVLLVG